MNLHKIRIPSADFVFRNFGNVIVVVDLCSGRNVTNDIDRVIHRIAAHFDLSRSRVIYRDATGVWDEILVQDARFAGFCAINERRLERALAKTGGVQRPSF